ncbi:hypothetical protein, partial [Ciceribacter ferrooxidans]
MDGITEQQCKDKGCCYDSNTPGSKWCFDPTLTAEKSICNPNSRINCAASGVLEQQCYATNCCYDDKTPNIPFCYQPQRNQVTVTCNVPASAKQNCGTNNITKDQCNLKG